MTFSPIILSRFNSSRLPGKVLMTINGIPIIHQIFNTLNQSFDRENIVVATSAKESDAPIANYCQLNQIPCFRGALENTALRFRDCAAQLTADYIIRICGDNLFIDLNTLAEMMTAVIKGNYLFYSNTPGRTFPYGMSFEIIERQHYIDSFDNFHTSDHFEHVTKYFYEQESERHHFHKNTHTPQAAGLQFAIDTQDDYDRAVKMVNKMTKEIHEHNLTELVSLYRSI